MKRNIMIASLIIITIGIIATIGFIVLYIQHTKPELSSMDSTMSIYEDDIKQIDLAELTFTQGEIGSLTYTIKSLPEHGNAWIGKDSNGNFYVSYAPDRDYYGTDEFTYSVTNGKLTSSGTISIRIKSIDDEPKTHNTKLMTNENIPITFDLSSIVIDIDSDDLIFTIDETTSNGVLS